MDMEAQSKILKRRTKQPKSKEAIQSRFEAIAPAAASKNGSSKWMTVTDLYYLGIVLKLKEKNHLMSWTGWYDATQDAFKRSDSVTLSNHQVKKRLGIHKNAAGKLFHREEFKFKPLKRRKPARQLGSLITV
jgi:hypothetical protein